MGHYCIFWIQELIYAEDFRDWKPEEIVLFPYVHQNTNSLFDFVEAGCFRALLCKLLAAEPRYS